MILANGISMDGATVGATTAAILVVFLIVAWPFQKGFACYRRDWPSDAIFRAIAFSVLPVFAGWSLSDWTWGERVAAHQLAFVVTVTLLPIGVFTAPLAIACWSFVAGRITRILANRWAVAKSEP